MPLSKKVLQDELSKFMDQESPIFEGFPDSKAAAALKYAAAFGAYAIGVTPVSTAVVTAQGTLQLAIRGAFDSPGQFQNLLGPSVAAFAATIGGGMTAAGFTGAITAPPPAYKPIFDVGAKSKASVTVNGIANLTHAYFSLGIATNITSGATIKWL